MKSALLVIDVQNEYFASENGAFPQANANEIGVKIAQYIQKSQENNQLVIAIQHIVSENSPMFARGSHGAAFHACVADLLANQPLIIKAHADSFFQTDLAKILKNNQINQIDICGIMTQNCVTHTALSPDALPYHVRVLADLCTAPSELIHTIAIRALKDRNSSRFEVI